LISRSRIDIFFDRVMPNYIELVLNGERGDNHCTITCVIVAFIVIYFYFPSIQKKLFKASHKQFADPNSTKSDLYDAGGRCPKIDLSSSSKKTVVKIAIIGSGVGGASAAQGLCERFTNGSIDLTIIEKTDRIGGRCKVIECSESKERFESGASIVSDLNELFKAYMERLNLKRMKKVDIPLLIHGGSKNNDDSSWILVSPTSFGDILPSFLAIIFDRVFSLRWKLLFLDVAGTIQTLRKYGLWKLRSLKNVLSKDPRNKLEFKKLYNNLESGTKAYQTPEDMLLEICMNDVEKYNRLTKNSAQIAIFGNEEKTPIIKDLVDTGARCNYGGQDCDHLHGFVGLVSLAGGIASKCFAVEGGNEQVPRGLIEQLISENSEGIEESDTNETSHVAADKTSIGKEGKFQIMFNTKCIEIKKGDSGGYVVKMKQEEKSIVRQYDIVLFCSPIERSSEVKFVPNVPSIDSWKKEQHKMRRCVTTFVRGILNSNMYPTTAKAFFPIVEVLTTSQSDLPIYSLAVKIPCTLKTAEEIGTYLTTKYQKQMETNEPQFAYKIFSPDILTQQDLDLLFQSNWKKITIEDWYAYPEYRIPQDFLPFVLEKSSKSLLLYENAIEQGAGAMEMSLISGRNLSNLTADWVKENW